MEGVIGVPKVNTQPQGYGSVAQMGMVLARLAGITFFYIVLGKAYITADDSTEFDVNSASFLAQTSLVQCILAFALAAYDSRKSQYSIKEYFSVHIDARLVWVTLLLALCYTISGTLLLHFLPERSTQGDTLVFGLLPLAVSIFTVVFTHTPVQLSTWNAVVVQMLGSWVAHFGGNGGTLQCSLTVLVAALLVTALAYAVHSHLSKAHKAPFHVQNTLLFGFGVLVNVLWFFVNPENEDCGYFDGFSNLKWSIFYAQVVYSFVVCIALRQGNGVEIGLATSLGSILLLLMLCDEAIHSPYAYLGTGLLLFAVHMYTSTNVKPLSAAPGQSDKRGIVPRVVGTLFLTCIIGSLYLFPFDKAAANAEHAAVNELPITLVTRESASATELTAQLLQDADFVLPSEIHEAVGNVWIYVHGDFSELDARAFVDYMVAISEGRALYFVCFDTADKSNKQFLRQLPDNPSYGVIYKQHSFIERDDGATFTELIALETLATTLSDKIIASGVGEGLNDKDMTVILPAKYDYSTPPEWRLGNLRTFLERHPTTVLFAHSTAELIVMPRVVQRYLMGFLFVDLTNPLFGESCKHVGRTHHDLFQLIADCTELVPSTQLELYGTMLDHKEKL